MNPGRFLGGMSDSGAVESLGVLGVTFPSLVLM